jgi:hypothetical protein
MTGRHGFPGVILPNFLSFQKLKKTVGVWERNCSAFTFGLLILLVVLVSGGAARAVDWPPLEPQDLKMTSLPEQPGAAAVILLREELDNDPMNFEQTYMRIKILTEQGKDLGAVEVPYSRRNFKLEEVAGRTIHPDGTIIPFDGKVFDKQVVRTREQGGRGERVNVKSFSLPDVQVGSVIEYRFTLRYADHSFYAPEWRVQDQLYQRKASFKFIPYDGLLQLPHDEVGRGVAWTSMLPNGMAPQFKEVPTTSITTTRQVSNYVELNVHDVAPLVSEPFMPPRETMVYRVRFYYTVTPKQDQYWKDEGKYWNKDVEAFLGKKNGLDAAVQAATAGASSPEQKVRNLYGMISAMENWSYEPARAQQEDKALGIKTNAGAEDVLRQHGGTHDDLNRLFVAMARTAGIPAYLMLVPSRDQQIFEPALLSMHQFAAEIAIVPLDGKDTFLDPGTKFCPYGVLDWRFSSTHGLRQDASGKGTTFGETPLVDYKKNMLQRLAKLQLNEDGKAEGLVNIGFYGQEKMDLRREGGKTDAEGKKKLLGDELKRWLPGDADVQVTGAPLDWDGTETGLIAKYKVSFPLAVGSGKRWVVPVHVFQVNEKPRFSASTRVNPVYFSHEFQELDEVHIAVPATMEVESLPKDEKVKTDFAVYVTEQKDEGNHSVRALRTLIMGGLLFPKDNYGELKTFFDQVSKGDEQPLLLKGAAHAENR